MIGAGVRGRLSEGSSTMVDVTIFDLPYQQRPASSRYSYHDGCIPTRELRYVLLSILEERREPTSVAELTDQLRLLQVPVAPPANKTISDALRAQLSRGRVVRQRRGVYLFGAMPDSTRYYVRSRAQTAVRHYRKPAAA